MARVFHGPLRGLAIVACASIFLATGCRTPYVQATVINSGGTELHNIEVDYPSASFGISSLAPGEAFHYRLKLEDAGRMKVTFQDDREKSHSGKGPYAAQSQSGTLILLLDGSGKDVWTVDLHPSVATPKGQ